MKNAIVSILILLIEFNVSFSQTTSEADKILGTWLVGSSKAHVKITKYGEKYAGRIVWLKEPTYEDGTPKMDKNNPNEKERTKPLLNNSILLGFVYKGKSTYKEGTIYDPDNGKTYDCVLKLTDDNTLDARGYIGVSLIGRTDTWKRIEGKK